MVVKLVVVVRTDLDMRKGKIAAQVAHAALYAERGTSSSVLDAWKANLERIVVLKTDNSESLASLSYLAAANGLKVYPVFDAGFTAVAPGTLTCLAIGPDEEGKVDAVTGSLKLL